MASSVENRIAPLHAVAVLGEPTLKDIARELVRASATIDRTDAQGLRPRQDARDGKRILRKYGYPPDKQERAVETVMEQATVLCGEWAA